MKNPGLSVAQVSQAVGFQSQSYFAKVFSKYIGVAPLIYRNSLS
jgi:AraC-like DNA-binding protein